MKLLIAAFVLIVAGCSQAGGQPTAPAPTDPPASAPAASSPAPTAASATGVVVKDFSLDPIDVTTGSTVSLAVTNEGPTIHNVKIRDGAGTVLAGTRDLREDESETITAEIPAGRYVMFCSLPGHESLGIKGSLVVAP